MSQVFKIWNTYISPATNALLDIGSDSLKFNNLYLDGIAYIDEITMGGNLDLNDFSIENISYLYGADPADFIRMGVANRLFITITGTGDPFATPDISISGSVWFDDDIGLATTKQIQFRDADIMIASDNDGDLDLDADSAIDFQIGGTEQVNLTDGALSPTIDNDIDLGTSSLMYKNVYMRGLNAVCSDSDIVCHNGEVVFV